MNAPGGAAPAGGGARRQVGLGQRQKYVINEGLAMEPGGMSAQQQKEWLGRSARWPDLQANHYVGKRVLGSGAHAIVGVWERQGNPPAAMPKLIVVKQVSDVGPGVLSIPLRVESKVMRDILGTNTEHVVKLYKSFYREGGSGSHTQRDPLPFGNNGAWAPARFVARFYMEHCRNGNLKSQLDKVIEQGEVIPEEYIWRFLHCLASALVVIRHGNEDHLNNGPTWNIPIAHFDIKPGNILIDTHDDNHKRLPVFKLGDFGLALPLPPEIFSQNLWNAWPVATRGDWTGDTLWRCTPEYTPPEQVYQANQDRIGFRSDIWSTGVVLYEMMTGKIFQTWVNVAGGTLVSQHTFQSIAANPTQQPFETFGRDIINRHYSRRLINLTHRCLAMNPVIRPTPRRLLRAARDMLNNVYTPIRNPQKKVQLSQDIADAPQHNHNDLARYSPAAIAAFAQLIPRSFVKQPGPPAPWWPVGPESQVPPLPPFLPGQPLNQNAYPWAAIANAPAAPNQGVTTRAAERRAAQVNIRESGN